MCVGQFCFVGEDFQFVDVVFDQKSGHFMIYFVDPGGEDHEGVEYIVFNGDVHQYDQCDEGPDELFFICQVVHNWNHNMIKWLL